jgi:SPP1 gp7 family putative phage head morphogenesis protein
MARRHHHPLHAPHAVTVQRIRFLRMVGAHSPPRRRGRIPPPLQPDMIRLAYYNALVPFLRLAQHEMEHYRSEILRLLDEDRHERGITDHRDAGRRSERAKELVDKAARDFASNLRPTALEDVVTKFGKQTSDFQRRQLDNQVQAALGVPLGAIERPVTEKIEGWAAINIDLIKTVPDRYFDRLRLDVLEAFEHGEHPDTLTEDFVDRYGMAENDARRIARDQIGKLSSQLNTERQQALGVTHFIWRTMRDPGVCDFCEPLEGAVFEYDDPPECMPGECHPQDRCYAEAVFDTIEGELGGGED